ncbi:MAG: hypothetical protein WD715_17450 [Dongiaceae bacterium]
MDTQFLTYIRRRRAELQRELNELAVAERQFLRSQSIRAQEPVEPKPIHIDTSTMFQPIQQRGASQVTIKEAVVDVLEKHPVGLTALQLLDKINSEFGLNIRRTSLSPQLSRLKREGAIFNDRQLWKRQNKDAPPA